MTGEYFFFSPSQDTFSVMQPIHGLAGYLADVLIVEAVHLVVQPCQTGEISDCHRIKSVDDYGDLGDVTLVVGGAVCPYRLVGTVGVGVASATLCACILQPDPNVFSCL